MKKKYLKIDIIILNYAVKQATIASDWNNTHEVIDHNPISRLENAKVTIGQNSDGVTGK